MKLGKLYYPKRPIAPTVPDAKAFAFLEKHEDEHGNRIRPAMRQVIGHRIAPGMPVRVVADGILPANEVNRGEIVSRRIQEDGLRLTTMSAGRFVRETTHVARGQAEIQIGAHGQDRLAQILLFREFLLNWRKQTPQSRQAMRMASSILAEQMIRGRTELRKVAAEVFDELRDGKDSLGRDNPGRALAKSLRLLPTLAQQIEIDESRLPSILRRMAEARLFMADLTDHAASVAWACDDFSVDMEALWGMIEHLQIKPFDYVVRLARWMQAQGFTAGEIRSAIKQGILVELGLLWLDDTLSDYKYHSSTFTSLPVDDLMRVLPEMNFDPAYAALATRLAAAYDQFAMFFSKKNHSHVKTVAEAMQEDLRDRSRIDHYERFDAHHLNRRAEAAA